jgi:hypothetical protein
MGVGILLLVIGRTVDLGHYRSNQQVLFTKKENTEGKEKEKSQGKNRHSWFFSFSSFSVGWVLLSSIILISSWLVSFVYIPLRV